ncbi:GntR family transcriptional regulator [Marinicella litoralis]|uniref:GntR family transcriptional regulator n=1 Tax=Marinicella litoralis TaxID=644220 RepID=A0A4R6XUA0_9GAMM|nr:GntR family transcriptional regulator [Marinicella litoralis]TDR23575.1 GntR family transcriptional regulator [Marinicella litoralis]
MDPYLVLSQKDGRPMYLQIMEQIKSLVAQGEWHAGEKVPSIRELAVASKVSVITVKRAYQELEREGVLLTQPGVGSFVAKNDELGDQIMKQEIDKHLSKAWAQAKSFGLSLDELMARLKILATNNKGVKDE